MKELRLSMVELSACEMIIQHAQRCALIGGETRWINVGKDPVLGVELSSRGGCALVEERELGFAHPLIAQVSGWGSVKMRGACRVSMGESSAELFCRRCGGGDPVEARLCELSASIAEDGHDLHDRRGGVGESHESRDLMRDP